MGIGPIKDNGGAKVDAFALFQLLSNTNAEIFFGKTVHKGAWIAAAESPCHQ